MRRSRDIKCDKLFFGEIEMTTESLYVKLQKEWVEATGLKVGDYVKIIGTFTTNQLGCVGVWEKNKDRVGESYKIVGIRPNHLELDIPRTDCFNHFPFFVLEVVPKPTIEITCKVNGEVSSLKNLSEETLLRLRNQS